MDPVTLALAGTAGTAAAAYINAKYHVAKDLKTIARMKWAEREVVKATEEGRCNIYDIWEDSVKTVPPSTRAIWSRTGTYTFQEAQQRVLQYAGWLQSLGAKTGDCVGLYAPNSPEFVFLILAMWSIGCYPGMINYNLADKSLVHCVGIAGASIMIVDAEEPGLQERVSASQDQFTGINTIYLDRALKQQISTLPAVPQPRSVRKNQTGIFGLIYTSGTTGLPKAFPVEMPRIYVASVLAGATLDAKNSKTDPLDREVWYDCMPLYHGTGVIVGMTNLVSGMTLAIGKKFSASSFWKDIHDSKATAFIYVGETARYLLATPPSPLDKGHKLRLMHGNGLRPDVWEKFQKRFDVPEVFEFFTSTEGVFQISTWSRSGFGAKSVGHHGAIFRQYFKNLYVPVALDPETNDMWRDAKTGFAKRVPYTQGGEIICKLEGRDKWPGYHNNAEGTNKKFAFNVFEKGDIYYRPGDSLRRDDDGLWYFMDRLGDTFRWKGENVATTEVQEVMGLFPGIGEANVYGVEVPGADGRAGCAAVMLQGASADTFDWKGLTSFLRKKLPRYAVPVFVRVIRGEATAMGTHNNKQNKVLLRREGANVAAFGKEVPNGEADAMYWLTPGMSEYAPFSEAEWEAVNSKKAKL